MDGNGAGKGGAKARRGRPKKEKQAQEDGAAPTAAAAALLAASEPARTEEAPQPSLSRRLVKSLKQQLSQLGAGQADEVGAGDSALGGAGPASSKRPQRLCLHRHGATTFQAPTTVRACAWMPVDVWHAG